MRVKAQGGRAAKALPLGRNTIKYNCMQNMIRKPFARHEADLING
jgi:hypothetical protein